MSTYEIRLNGREVHSRTGRVTAVAALAVITTVVLVVGIIALVAVVAGLVVLSPVLAVTDVALRTAGRRGFVVRPDGGWAVLVNRGAFQKVR